MKSEAQTGSALERLLFRDDSRLPHRLAVFLLLALLFSLAYAQAPLYTSNQNQYMLRGAARAGMGDLETDWLVNTRDSTPLFSIFAGVVFRFLSPAAFYVVYGLLLGLYLFSLTGIARELYGFQGRGVLLAAAVLIGIHSAALRFVLGRIPGPHWEYLLEAGFAGQRLLGAVLQPSTIGVLLVLSVLLYLRRRPFVAVLAAVLAATVHPTYLLSAASLTMAYMVGEYLEQRTLRRPLLVGITALAAVLPVLIYVLGSFMPSSPGMTREAQALLVEFRIPQHAQIGLWFDATVVVKLILLAAALFLTRKKRLFFVLLVPAAVMLLLTVVQVALDSNQLALLFPWRLSTWLVPLATTVVSGMVLKRLLGYFDWLHRSSWIPAAAAGVVLALSLVGAAKFQIESRRKAADPANPMMAYVREHSEGDQVYMIPPKLQVFRLETGEPAMVDFKSIPYQDREVLEWYDRVRLARFFYRDRVEYIDCSLLDEAAGEYGVTHVVLGENQLGLDCPGLEELYRDSAYGVYLLNQGVRVTD